jgi:hypothetical protein
MGRAEEDGREDGHPGVQGVQLWRSRTGRVVNAIAEGVDERKIKEVEAA